MGLNLDTDFSNATHDSGGLKMMMAIRITLLRGMKLPLSTPIVVIVGDKVYEKVYYRFRAGSMILSVTDDKNDVLECGKLTLKDLVDNEIYDIRREMWLRNGKYDYVIGFDEIARIIQVRYLE